MNTYNFSVIDVETTGFSPKRRDRVIEIGITKINENGDTIDTFETLINPDRDVGPTSIHGITAEMILNAPKFIQISGNILSFLNNSLVVAHNAPYDIGFLINEFELSGIEIYKIPYVCTLSMSRNLFPELPSKKLLSLCNYFGIKIEKHHSALSDSFATAKLFIKILNDYLEIESIDKSKYFYISEIPEIATNTILKKRDTDGNIENKNINTIKDVIDRLPTIDGFDENAMAYAEKLDDILLDRIISKEETTLLLDIALESGISKNQAIQINEQYLKNIIRIALIDGKVSVSEINDIKKIRRLLDLEEMDIEKEIIELKKDKSIKQINVENINIRNKSVCFTGEFKSKLNGSIISRNMAQKLALERGMIIKNGVTKDLDYLVASDPNTLSSKAKKAKNFGIKIVDECAFWIKLGLQVE